MIVREIGWRSPLDAFAPLAGEPYAALLHAGERARTRGWTSLAAFPSTTLEARGRAVFVDGAPSAAAPFSVLAALHRARRSQNSGVFSWAYSLAPPLFLSGLVGFAGYEMGAALEPSAAGPPSPFRLPDMAFGAYDACALFNRGERRAFIASYTEEAGRRLEEALGIGPAAASPLPAFSGTASNFSERGFESAVAAAIGLIGDGAIFQANLAQQLSVRSDEPVAALSLFRLVAEADAPFAALLQYKEGAIVSNSPERFFKISREAGEWRVLAEPIKGTCERRPEDGADCAAAAALVADPKERAENIMIADLTRNDLSRISKDGSIREDAICALESYETVHHLVSRVSGALKDGVDAVDALAALFPCGSVTGAPKIEAMKTIAALEGIGRGPYCGAIGYIDDRGAADFSVAIRLMIVDAAAGASRVTIPVGGGVTLRSDPRAEYRETLAKARAALSILGVEADR
jgi:para-aminobenzoate synthetase component 1